MSLNRWFRLSGYITLGLSCGLLVFAEAFFLPSLRVCLAPVLALLLLAWWVEGRWCLPVWGANLLAAFIAVGGGVWLATHLADPNSWLNQAPLRVALMPFMGPLLMAALLVKIFQQRGPSDFWRVQGLGLMQVSLGCVLEAGPAFGALLAAYLASALASLALRYRQSVETTDSRRTPTVWWLLAFTFRWTLLVVALSLLLFLLTPRRDGSAWAALSGFRVGSDQLPQPQAGSSSEMNLNTTGTLELDDAPAFQVTATDSADRPKLDLPADQRWRGAVLDWYDTGRWTMSTRVLAPPRSRQIQRTLPEFGADQYFLTFTVQPRQAGGLVLAEPIRLGPSSAPLPVIPLANAGRPAQFFAHSGTVLPRRFSMRREYRYRQVIPVPADRFRTSAQSLHGDAYLERLTRQTVPGLRIWTIELLRRLSVQPRYPVPARVRVALTEPHAFLPIEPRDWEAVARVLTEYLAGSGEYTYTLELTRQDVTLDPAMDFLVNLKRGHCARYATALALMLRSLGVPARVVTGFLGADPQGDGLYMVRHHHAHAWVEMLTPQDNERGPPFDWLTLDPTPAESVSASKAFSLVHWWRETERSIAQFWQTLILDYNADEQADLWDRLQGGRRLFLLLKLGLLLLAVLLALAAFVLLRRLIRPRRAASPGPSDTVAFHARLLALLARYALLRPRFGQTPHEFGETARQFLQTRPGLIALANLPIRVVELFYRVRFGGQPLSAPESHALDIELDRLAEALHQTAHRRS